MFKKGMIINNPVILHAQYQSFFSLPISFSFYSLLHSLTPSSQLGRDVLIQV